MPALCTAGAHASRRMAFPEWVPSNVLKEAEALSIAEAEQVFSALLARQSVEKQRMRPTKAANPGVAALTPEALKKIDGPPKEPRMRIEN